MVKYRYLMLYLQQKCCCPFFYFTDFNNNKRKERKEKDKRKGLNGWCLLGHNDNFWYKIKMPPLLLRKSAQATLQLWWWNLSRRIFSPTPTNLSFVALLRCDADTGQVVFKTRKKEGKTKVYHSCSHHHHHPFVASNPPISSDFSGTKCPTAEKTYKL